MGSKQLEYSIRALDDKNIGLIKHYYNKDGNLAETTVGYFSTVEAAARKAAHLIINNRLEGAEDMDEFVKRLEQLHVNITDSIVVECKNQ